MNSAEMLSGSIAELALGAESVEQFRYEFQTIACKAFGADGCATYAFSSGGQTADVLVVPFGLKGARPTLNEDFPRYLSEISVAETNRHLEMQRSRSVVVEELYSSQQQEQLALFREYLRPLGVRCSVQRAWKMGGEVRVVAFARSSVLGRKQFTDQGLRLLDSIFPVIALAEKALASQRSLRASGDVLRTTTRAYNLTETEHIAVSLLARGLTNAEIAQVLGLSINTVRNRIAVCYTKLKVTRRAEAVFVLTNSLDTGT